MPSMPGGKPWSAEHLSDLSGKTIIVTGANSGLGYVTTLELARKGAHVILACRDAGRADAATDRIRAEIPAASLSVSPLDLASLASVRDFAKRFRESHEKLDILCNNAGVMAIPKRETADGYEMQLGTNHLGHFALTGLLIDRLLATPRARVVNLSSTAHRIGKMRFDDLHWKRGYGKWRAYGQSKLANLLFSYELQRKLEANKADAMSVACHPGYAATNLQFAGPRMAESTTMERFFGVANRIFSQTASMGALPTLYAATSPALRGGEYIGPDGFAETWGHPKLVRSSARSRDLAAAARLWQESESLTGVRYEALAL